MKSPRRQRILNANSGFPPAARGLGAKGERRTRKGSGRGRPQSPAVCRRARRRSHPRPALAVARLRKERGQEAARQGSAARFFPALGRLPEIKRDRGPNKRRANTMKAGRRARAASPTPAAAGNRYAPARQ